MGGQGSKEQEPKKPKGARDMSAIYKEYTPAYQEYKSNPNFFSITFLIQLTISPKFQGSLKM